MNHALYTAAEPFIVAVIVALCVLIVLRKQAPALWARITGRKARSGSCHDTGETDCASACGKCASKSGHEHVVNIHTPSR